MRLLTVNAHAGGVSGFLIPLCNRVKDFCKDFDSDADPDILAEAVAEAYFRETPGLLPFIVEEDGEIVAHAIVTVESYYGNINVNIPQFQKNKGTTIPPEIYEQFFTLITSWAKANGAGEIRMTARNKAVARVLGRLGFYESERVFMRRPVN